MRATPFMSIQCFSSIISTVTLFTVNVIVVYFQKFLLNLHLLFQS